MKTYGLIALLSLCLLPASAFANPAESFAQVCAVCHGVGGAGDGVAAAGLPVKPANFTNTAFWAERTDESVFKAIKEGGAAIGKSPLMAPYKGSLSDEQIKGIVSYLRTLIK